MTGQSSELENPCPNDLTARLRALIADTNVNNNAFLESDCLNYFNEIVMLMVSYILEDAKEWWLKTYAQYFLDSGRSDSAIIIKAYENVPVDPRKPLDVTVERINRSVNKGLERIEGALDSTKSEERAAATVTSLLQRLVEPASAIIHSETPQLEHDEINDLLSP
jgi:hypothetical protein